MKLFWQNHVDAYETTISASSEISTLPVENVAHEFRARVWRTGTNLSDEFVDFDFGSAQPVNGAVVIGHTLTDSDSDIKLSYSNSGTTSMTDLVSWVTPDEPMWATFGAVAARHWRFSFTKPSASDQRDIGRVFIGRVFASDSVPDEKGYSRKKEDRSLKQKSVGGQTYTDVRDQYRMVKLKFSYVPNEEKETLDEIFDLVGEHQSLFIVADERNDSPDELRVPMYVKMAKIPDVDVAAWDGDYFWDLDIECEEQL